MNQEIKKLNEKSMEYSKDIGEAIAEVRKTIVGQYDLIEKIMVALIADGHVLVEGVPGLAKTLTIKTISDTLKADFVRLQFTPDLLPSDILGTKIFNQKDSTFKTKKGPIFSNFVLADEINRAPPKVQSALLEAMQERQVTIQGETFPLERPFLVLATQNPIETEGTYKLPEAQVDRFMFKLLVHYPDKQEEKMIIQRFTQGVAIKTSKVLDTKKIIEIQSFCQEIYADEKIEEYVSELVDATRHPQQYKLDVDSYIEYGASPRASIWLILAGKAHAMLNQRGFVIPEDIKAVCHDVLRHRIMLTYEAEAEGIRSDDIVDRLISKIKVP